MAEQQQRPDDQPPPPTAIEPVHSQDRAHGEELSPWRDFNAGMNAHIPQNPPQRVHSSAERESTRIGGVPGVTLTPSATVPPLTLTPHALRDESVPAPLSEAEQEPGTGVKDDAA